MQRLEVSGAVRPTYGSLGVKRLTKHLKRLKFQDTQEWKLVSFGKTSTWLWQ